jgi:hypothetical protein
MTTESGAETAVETTATEANETVQAAYDRIANPGKAQEEPKEVVTPTAPTPPESVISVDEIKELKAQVSRIPDLEKRLRDEGGRYGALKQSLEQIQQRIADKKESSGSDLNVDEILADIKKDFGEDELYNGLKSAFSKVAGGRGLDTDAIEKIVADKISAAKHAEREDAVAQLSEVRPTWRQDVAAPEFQECQSSLTARERDKLGRSNDPDYVSDKLSEFDEWKAKKSAAPGRTEEQKAETKPGPSKRLASAVLPTNGTKPKAAGDDKQTQIRAAYERVAGNRR